MYFFSSNDEDEHPRSSLLLLQFVPLIITFIQMSHWAMKHQELELTVSKLLAHSLTAFNPVTGKHFAAQRTCYGQSFRPIIACADGAQLKL